MGLEGFLEGADPEGKGAWGISEALIFERIQFSQ